MITGDQFLCHVFGDYILQSHTMAVKKTTSYVWALAHAYMYTLPFAIFLGGSFRALAVICLTHWVIDRFNLARYVVFAKNWLLGDWIYMLICYRWGFKQQDIIENDRKYAELLWCDHTKSHLCLTVTYEGCHKTGYPASTPLFLSLWLTIIADNAIHILINGVALYYL